MTCEYCVRDINNKELCDTSFSPCSGYIFAQIEGQTLHIEARSSYNDWHDSDDVSVNFCPMCGQDLRLVR